MYATIHSKSDPGNIRPGRDNYNELAIRICNKNIRGARFAECCNHIDDLIQELFVFCFSLVFCVKKGPEKLSKSQPPKGKQFKAAFIDLETTGLDPRNDEIIEIGTLIGVVCNKSIFRL